MVKVASWEYETRFINKGITRIAGLDEVGRGCWAGPLVAVAYSFHTIPTDIDLYDSKVIPETKRNNLEQALKTLGLFGLGEVTASEIDELGLQVAQYTAYNRALANLPLQPEIILLDGRPWKNSPIDCESIIDGDAKVASIAAASIIAKVHRDTLMKGQFHNQYPQYSFNKHVGYGTKLHQEAIQKYGILAIHRKSFKPIQALLV